MEHQMKEDRERELVLLKLLLAETNPHMRSFYFKLLQRNSDGNNIVPGFVYANPDSDSESHSTYSSHTSRVEPPPSVATYLKNGDRGIYFYEDTSKPPIDVFATFEEAAAALNDDAMASEIESACVTNARYKGFRFVDKRHDAEIPIPPSRKQRKGPAMKGLVARLNLAGTHIIDVYSNQKSAIESMKQAGERISNLSNALRKGKPCNNSLWKMYSDCDKSIQDTFQGELPEERLPGKRRISPETDANIEAPEVNVEAPEVNVEAHEVNVEAPEVKLEAPDPKIEVPDPKIEVPDPKIEVPEVTA